MPINEPAPPKPDPDPERNVDEHGAGLPEESGETPPEKPQEPETVKCYPQ